MSDDSSNDVSFDEDDFNRKIIAENMVSLLLSEIDVSPIIIDGPWGSGKTTFCKKSIKLIKKSHQDKKRATCAYIDAFNADHANQPLITIIAAISNSISEENQSKQEFIRKAKNVARYAGKSILRAGFAWILKTEADNLDKEFTDAIQDGFDHALNNIIKEHEEIEKNINLLKETLKEIVKNNSLIIFIDELDRCRPDFSIAILEIIKHIFNVEGVKFVLVTNYTQMKASINHCYGKEVDAQRYLDKFIKFSFKLPSEILDKNQKSQLASVEHAKQEINKRNLLKQSPLIAHPNITFINELIIQNELSLREVETFIRHMEIYYFFANRSGWQLPFDKELLLAIFAIFIFSTKSYLCDQIEKKQPVSLELCKLLGATHYIDKKNIQKPSYNQILAHLIMIVMNDGSVPGYTNTRDDAEQWKQISGFDIDNDKAFQQHLFDFFINEFRKMRLQFPEFNQLKR